MNEYRPQFWFRAEHVGADFSADGERQVAAWLRDRLQALGYAARAPEEQSWGHRIRIDSAVPLYVDCAPARRVTGSPFAPPCWIAEVNADDGLKIGCEGRVTALPVVAQVGRDLKGILGEDAGAWIH
ncbi:hypothetical protein PE066_12770 [Ramlibacter tataouinensis]|uniref:hypothetical protein n=1 Tax=Ramlibacter tataouinensis TaxID=94132 RepID=UPI0022F3A5AD|nr:hypothetical protein [Ramlibacter tataouinensis]WBY00345.1 hypothetical protein PE066_12770 [Ramlibacter tataouinensis]